jgi:hypothetical protein
MTSAAVNVWGQLSSLQATRDRLRYSKSVQPTSGIWPNSSAVLQKSPDTRTRSAPSNKGGISMRKLNQGRTNEVVYCESCAVPSARRVKLGNSDTAKRSPSSKPENKGTYEAGASVAIDTLGGDLQMIVRGILPCNYSTSSRHVSVVSNCIFRVRRLLMGR